MHSDRNRQLVVLHHIQWKRLAGERPIYLFGSGVAGQLLIEYLRTVEYQLAGIIDNDKNKWGKKLFGLEVFAPVPEIVNKENFIIIASSYHADIEKQLVDLGLRKNQDYSNDYVSWFSTLSTYRFAQFSDIPENINQAEFLPRVQNSSMSVHKLVHKDLSQPSEQDLHFFIHNSMHAGDVILTRPFINELRKAFPQLRITLECSAERKYLWEDLKLPIVIYEGKEYRETTPTPNCPSDAIFINIWFGVFPDILSNYGLSYENNVYTFNRYMHQYRLQHIFQLANKTYVPMMDFNSNQSSPFIVQENSIMVENGAVFSGQSNFPLNDYLEDLARAFPNLYFYCAAPIRFDAPNVVDCSNLNLIELSELSNHCSGFLTLGSGVNAALQTENNRFKPKCIAGWNYQWKVWYDTENPTIFAQNVKEIKCFLLTISEKAKTRMLSSLEPVMLHNAARYCKFLRSRSEIERCTEYLKKNGLVSHAVICKDWEIAHIIADLSEGHLLDMGSSDSYILKNAVIKGVKGEKFGIDLRTPNVPLASVNYIEGDLMEVPLPDEYFQNITCLSVIEHEVNIKRFAAETARLLKHEGKLYVTFDYWEPKVKADMKLYGLEWNILDKEDVLMLIAECAQRGLQLVEEIDWTLGKAVINEEYCAPAKVGYTFGMLVFQKIK